MRVVLAEDSLLLREGLVRLLDEAGAEVVAAVGDGAALVTAVAAHRPDVAVVDVRMPPTFTDEGLRAALEIRPEVPGTAILVLSQYVEESYASEPARGRRLRRLPTQGPGVQAGRSVRCAGPVWGQNAPGSRNKPMTSGRPADEQGCHYRANGSGDALNDAGGSMCTTY